jgi:hypothetical protein
MILEVGGVKEEDVGFYSGLIVSVLSFLLEPPRKYGLKATTWRNG